MPSVYLVKFSKRIVLEWANQPYANPGARIEPGKADAG